MDPHAGSRALNRRALRPTEPGRRLTPGAPTCEGVVAAHPHCGAPTIPPGPLDHPLIGHPGSFTPPIWAPRRRDQRDVSVQVVAKVLAALGGEPVETVQP